MAAQKIIRKAARILRNRFVSFRDQHFSTYTPFQTEVPLRRFFQPILLEVLLPQAEQIHEVCQLYHQHFFDLLGSGWVQVKHGLVCRGVEGHRYQMGNKVTVDRGGEWLKPFINRANYSHAKAIWQHVDPDYIPIDWQLDFKSGYRWSVTTPSHEIRYGHLLGVDVKVPWELSRMQHLPYFVWAYVLAGHKGFADSQIYPREFRNQVLDFIAQNPPRYGVNWNCTMDVGIRVANWLVTYDLFRAYGVQFDPAFETIFRQSIYQHGHHIIHHLEWSSTLRANHYLADIVGLLFVAAYLTTAEKWLAFAIEQVIAETQEQFYPTGENFEGSTSYHRLSGEMVAYASALILALGYPLPEAYQSRLAGIASFSQAIAKPNGKVPQIGDNDSGRFFKFQPVFQKRTVSESVNRYQNLAGYANLPPDAPYWDEDFSSHQHLVAAISGLFQNPPTTDLDNHLIRGIVGDHQLPVPIPSTVQQNYRDFQVIRDELAALPNRQERIYRFPIPDVPRQVIAYPDFGIYILRSAHLYLAIRCGVIGQKGNGGHAHNDQLAVELWIKGDDIFQERGTYLYTPLPHRRNEYRSVQAHFAPQVEGMEPEDLGRGLFTLSNRAVAHCLHFSEKGFIGTHSGYGAPLYRLITWEAKQLTISDIFLGTAPLLPMPSTDQMPPLSPKYGVIQRKSTTE
jgi:hypothetical protein